MKSNNELKNQFSSRGPIHGSSSFNSYRASPQYMSFESDNMGTNLPQQSQMSSIQKSKNFVESHSTSSGVMNKSILNEMRKQQSFEVPSQQTIPVIYSTSASKGMGSHIDGGSMFNQSIIVGEGNVRLVTPVESVRRSSSHLTEDSIDSHHEEKTVTIKRKITRRKKGSENVSTLRDSYIDAIGSPLPTYDTESDTDDEKFKTIKQPTRSIVPEEISIKKAATNETLPTILVTSPAPIKEDFIVPSKKGAVASGIPFENPKNLDRRDGSISNVETTNETFITERKTAPISTYSARKENIRSQQMSESRNLGPVFLQPERNLGQRSEMTEEMESITLQPIGRGVQDLALIQGSTHSRPVSRSTTPRGFDSGVGTVRSNYSREESNHIGSYNTMPPLQKFIKTNSVRNIYQTNNDLTDNNSGATSLHRVTNQQTNNAFFNRPSNEQSERMTFNKGTSEQMHGATINRFTNEQTLNGATQAQMFQRSPSRAANEQTINTSWHTRTESYGGGGHSYQAAISPQPHQGGFSGNGMVTYTKEDQNRNFQMVLNTEEQWYQPRFTRDDAINGLRDKVTGSFYIRKSYTVDNAYGLAMKAVALPSNAVRTDDHLGDLVRHFLIVTVNDTSGSGVIIKDLDNEIVYPSLAHLVHAHCLNAISLPNRLTLPQTAALAMDQVDNMKAGTQYQYESHQHQQLMEAPKIQLLSQSHRSLSSPGVNFSDIRHPNPLHKSYELMTLYLGKVEVGRLTGDIAIEVAVDKLMKKKSRMTSTVAIKLDSTRGVTLHDKMERMFYTRQFPAQHVLHAAFDPLGREFGSNMFQNNGIDSGRIFGIVVKKQSMLARDNVVHMFCEMDNSNSISNIVTFVNENYLRRL